MTRTAMVALVALVLGGCRTADPPVTGPTASPVASGPLDVFVVDAQVTGPLGETMTVEAHPPGRLQPNELLRPLFTLDATEDTSIWSLVTFAEAVAPQAGPGRLGVAGVCGYGWTASGERVTVDPCSALSPAARVPAEAPLTISVTLFPATDQGAAAPGRYRVAMPLDPDDTVSTLVLEYDLVEAGSRPLPDLASPSDATGWLTVVLDEVPVLFHQPKAPPLRFVVEDPYGRVVGERGWQEVRASTADDQAPTWAVEVPLGPWRAVALTRAPEGEGLVRCAGGQTVLTPQEPDQRLALIFDAVDTDGRCLHAG